MSIQRCENIPNLAASTVSPGERGLELAASPPPVPVEGRRITSPPAPVFRTTRHPATPGVSIRANSGDRGAGLDDLVSLSLGKQEVDRGGDGDDDHTTHKDGRGVATLAAVHGAAA